MPLPRFSRGLSYAAISEHREAINDFTEVIKLEPKNTDAYNNRGLSNAAIGEHRKAINDFTEVIKLEPKNTDAYNNRALSYAQLGDFLEAIDDLTTAIKLNREFVLAYGNRGIVYASIGEHHKAVSDFTSAIELDPQNKDAYDYRSISKVLLGRYEEAKEDFELGNSSTNLPLFEAFEKKNRTLETQNKILESHIGGLRAQFGDTSYYLEAIVEREEYLSTVKNERKIALRWLKGFSTAVVVLATILITLLILSGLGNTFSILSISFLTVALISPYAWGVSLIQSDLNKAQALLESYRTIFDVSKRMDIARQEAESKEEREWLNRRMIEFHAELRIANLLLEKDGQTTSTLDQSWKALQRTTKSSESQGDT